MKPLLIKWERAPITCGRSMCRVAKMADAKGTVKASICISHIGVTASAAVINRQEWRIADNATTCRFESCLYTPDQTRPMGHGTALRNSEEVGRQGYRFSFREHCLPIDIDPHAPPCSAFFVIGGFKEMNIKQEKMDKKEVCEDCQGTGWYGDQGPGIKGNREYVPCECKWKKKK